MIVSSLSQVLKPCMLLFREGIKKVVIFHFEVQQDCTVCVQNCSLHCSCSGVAFHTTGKRVCLPVVWEGSASAGD